MGKRFRYSVSCGPSSAETWVVRRHSIHSSSVSIFPQTPLTSIAGFCPKIRFWGRCGRIIAFGRAGHGGSPGLLHAVIGPPAASIAGLTPANGTRRRHTHRITSPCDLSSFKSYPPYLGSTRLFHSSSIRRRSHVGKPD